MSLFSLLLLKAKDEFKSKIVKIYSNFFDRQKNAKVCETMYL